MTGSKEQGKKAAATLKAKDPLYYVKLGHRSQQDPNRNRYSWFRNMAENDPDRLKEVSSRGGKKSRRGSK